MWAGGYETNDVDLMAVGPVSFPVSINFYSCRMRTTGLWLAFTGRPDEQHHRFVHQPMVM